MPVNDLTKGEDDDLFGSALELEQAHYQEGYNDGIWYVVSCIRTKD